MKRASTRASGAAIPLPKSPAAARRCSGGARRRRRRAGRAGGTRRRAGRRREGAGQRSGSPSRRARTSSAQRSTHRRSRLTRARPRARGRLAIVSVERGVVSAAPAPRHARRPGPARSAVSTSRRARRPSRRGAGADGARTGRVGGAGTRRSSRRRHRRAGLEPPVSRAPAAAAGAPACALGGRRSARRAPTGRRRWHRSPGPRPAVAHEAQRAGRPSAGQTRHRGVHADRPGRQRAIFQARCATRRRSRVKAGLAEMLKGGVIMDVVTPEQAHRRGRRRLRGDGARARARGHPPRRRRGAHVGPGDDHGDPGGGHDPGDGEGAHRPLRRGAGARGARGRLRRRVRGPDPGRRGQPHRQVGASRSRSCAARRTSARRCGASARARR